MDTIIGLLLLLAGVCLAGYNYYFVGFDNIEPMAIIQILVAVGGGLIVIAPTILRKIKNFKLPDIDLDINKDDEMEELEFNFDPKSKMDFACLHYLKDRAVELKSPEALELVIKLNTLLFSEECEDCDEKKKN